MIAKINHIGIAVQDVDEVVKLYSNALGLECESISSVEDQKVKLAFLPIGDTRIELLEGTSSDSPIAKHIERRGEGIHHIALPARIVQFLAAESTERLLNRRIRSMFWVEFQA